MIDLVTGEPWCLKEASLEEMESNVHVIDRSILYGGVRKKEELSVTVDVICAWSLEKLRWLGN